MRQYAPLETGPHKLTEPQQVEQLFKYLLNILATEWRNIRSLNLGVKSGTGVVDELLVRKVQQCAAELHTLCISNDRAAERLAKLAQTLPRKELQQLQTLLDVTDHQVLSDYINVIVYNTSHPPRNGSGQDLYNTGTAGLKRRKAAKKNANSSHSQVISGNGQVSTQQWLSDRRPWRDDPLFKFAGFLNDEHPLVQAAYNIHQNRVREAEEKAAAEARADADRQAALAAEKATRLEALRQRTAQARVEWELQHSKAEKERKLEGSLGTVGLEDLEDAWRDLGKKGGVMTRLTTPSSFLNDILLSDPLRSYSVEPAVSEWRRPQALQLERNISGASVASNASGMPSTRLASSRSIARLKSAKTPAQDTAPPPNETVSSARTVRQSLPSAKSLRFAGVGPAMMPSTAGGALGASRPPSATGPGQASHPGSRPSSRPPSGGLDKDSSAPAVSLPAVGALSGTATPTSNRPRANSTSLDPPGQPPSRPG